MELLVVIAIIGIIASLATPSLIRFVQQYQVNSETRSLVATMQEARSKSMLNKRNDNPLTTWTSSRSHIKVNGHGSLILQYDFMGRPNGAWKTRVQGLTNNCLNITHGTSIDGVTTSVQIDPITGRFEVFKNKAKCAN